MGCNIEGIPKVVQVGILVQPGEIDEIRPMVIDQGVESEPVLPGLQEVLDVDVLIYVCSSLTPEQQGFLGHFFSVVFPDAVSMSSTSISISWIWKRRMIVQMRPRIILRLPSTICSAPIFSSLTLVWRKARDLLIFSILQFGIFQDNRTHSSHNSP